MINPGVFALSQLDGESDVTITAAASYACDEIDDLDGLTAVTISSRFAYGSGGTTARLYIQTRFGGIWVDIACMLFATASAHRIVNLSGLTPKTTAVTPTDGALTDDTCLDGCLGDALRAKIVTVGTYAGTTLMIVRAAVR